MAISWNVDDLRKTVETQIAQADRLDAVIDELSARAETAEAQLEAVRQALGGYPDSDLVSLATTLRARVDAVERELEQARDYVDNAIGNTNPAVPLVDRIVRLVSMLAANSTKA